MKLLDKLGEYGNLDKVKNLFKVWYTREVEPSTQVSLQSFLQGKLENQFLVFNEFFAWNNLNLMIDLRNSEIIIQVIEPENYIPLKYKDKPEQFNRELYATLGLFEERIPASSPCKKNCIDAIRYLTSKGICEVLYKLNLEL